MDAGGRATQKQLPRMRVSHFKIFPNPLSKLVSLVLSVFAASLAAEMTFADDLPIPVIQVLKQYKLSERGLSIYVQELDKPEPLLSVAADTPRHPASVIKLLTTLAGLEELGPGYRWKTEAYVTGPIRAGRLDGDLYLKGYGDPYLVVEYFWQLLRGLRAQGLRTIGGDLIIDQSYFAQEPGDASDFDGQPLRAYNVLPRALLINFQAVNFRFMPSLAGKRLRIVADPLPALLEVENRVTLTHGLCRGWSRNLSMQLQNKGNETKVVFSGTYDAACGDNELFRVVSEPLPFIHGMFKTLWLELGGGFVGTARDGVVPENAARLYTADSPPLADIVRSINKYSNNVMARQMMLTLGAERLGPPGTTEKGAQAVRDWLKRRDLSFPELALENGAGLSRNEWISARHLGEVLLTAYRSPSMPEFMSSLPIAAMDGTLRKRFGGSELEGRLHLKTGSLDDVRSIAGYLLDRRGRRMAVVCLHNHVHADSAAGEAVQDALLRWVYERP